MVVPQLGFRAIDHLTNNVPHGAMRRWVDFYQQIFGFTEVRYFDIRGARVGMFVQLHNALGHDNPGAYAGESFCSEWDRTQNGCRPAPKFDGGLPRLPILGFRVAF